MLTAKRRDERRLAVRCADRIAFGFGLGFGTGSGAARLAGGTGRGELLDQTGRHSAVRFERLCPLERRHGLAGLDALLAIDRPRVEAQGSQSLLSLEDKPRALFGPKAGNQDLADPAVDLQSRRGLEGADRLGRLGPFDAIDGAGSVAQIGQQCWASRTPPPKTKARLRMPLRAVRHSHRRQERSKTRKARSKQIRPHFARDNHVMASLAKYTPLIPRRDYFYAISRSHQRISRRSARYKSHEGYISTSTAGRRYSSGNSGAKARGR